MTHRYLLVGDPHVVVDELPECQRLADYIRQIMAEQGQNTSLVLLGDLYNNHAVVRVEVMDFWHRFFRDMTAHTVWALVGNHDRPQSGIQGNVHSLMAHDEGCVYVVSSPRHDGNVGFIPYMPTVEAFEQALQELGHPPLVFAHQSFQGCQYENGFYAPDGVSTSILRGTKVISGHIHTPQQVGAVWYPGAPRWRSIADANVDRFLYLIEVDDLGNYHEVKRYPTDTVCSPIRLQTVTDLEAVKALQNAPGLRVTVQGDESFVKEAESILAKKGIRFRSVVIGSLEPTGQIRESAGIAVAFKRFWDAFTPPGHTPKEALGRLVSSRLAW